jgi:PAS domain S-box-containing protein
MKPTFATFRAASESLKAAATVEDLTNRVVAAIVSAFGAERAQLWAVELPDAPPSLLAEATPGREGDGVRDPASRSANAPGCKWLSTFLAELDQASPRIFTPDDVRAWSPLAASDMTDRGIAALTLTPVSMANRGRGALLCWLRDAPSDEWVQALSALAVTVDVVLAGLQRMRDRDTAWVQANEEIARLSRQEELLLTSAGEGICGLDRDGNVTFVNPAAARLLGYDVSELTGQAFHPLVHFAKEDSTPYLRAECPICAALRDGAVHRVTGEVFWRRDGTSLPVDYVSAPIRADDSIVGAVVIFADMTERRRAEASQARLLLEAEAAEERFRGFLEWAPDAIVVVSEQGRIVLVNHQAELMFGYDRQNLIGQSVELLVPEQLRQIHRKHRDRYSASPTTRPMGVGLNLVARRRDGSEFPVEISLSPSETGGRRLVTSVIRDISERTRLFEAERRARADAEKLASERAATLSKIADGVVLANPSGNVTFANDAARRLLPSIGTITGDGEDDVEMVLRDLRTAQGQPFALAEIPLVRAARAGETISSIDARIRRPNGKELIVEVSAVPVVTESREHLGAVMTIRDVTAQRDVERQKDEFLANVSHDLRTPLTAIKASIGVVLANEPPRTPEPLHRLFVNIELSADRMANLVTDLLELTRLQAGRAPFRPIWCNLNDVARQSARTIEPLMGAKNQHLALDLPAEPIYTRGDPDRLGRALLNLLSNAQKYGKTGGSIRLNLRVGPAEALFTVADDGLGIDPDEQKRIFERFYRSEAEATQRRQGSGLGLPIARAMVELHGGRIWVESTPGQGTVFSVALPLIPRALMPIEEGGK